MDKYDDLTSQDTAIYLEQLDKIGWFDCPQNDKNLIT
jgi:hypothetical protein